MKFIVNENCVGCGMCTGTCPRVFSFNDNGTISAIENDVPYDAEDSAVEAMNSCPMSAIEEA